MNMCTTVQPVRTVRDRLGRRVRDLRISVIETCNYRCPYCMPAGLTPDQIETHNSASRLDFTEIEQLARAFAALGVRKLRLTGGEPLLRRDLPELVARLARIPGIDDIAMTSNGSLLPRHAAALRAAGLTRITLSLDTLDPQRFSELSGGRGRLQDVLAAIAAARAAGFPRVKINCVVQRGINDQDVFDLVAHFRGSGHVLRFIEYMDVGTCNGWRHEQVVPSAELRARIDARSIRSMRARLQAAMRSLTGPAKSVSSVRSAPHSAVTVIVPGSAPTVSCTPACSPSTAYRCGRCWSCLSSSCRSALPRSGSSARIDTARFVPVWRRDRVVVSRCSWSEVEDERSAQG